MDALWNGVEHWVTYLTTMLLERAIIKLNRYICIAFTELFISFYTPKYIAKQKKKNVSLINWLQIQYNTHTNKCLFIKVTMVPIDDSKRPASGNNMGSLRPCRSL